MSKDQQGTGQTVSKDEPTGDELTLFQYSTLSSLQAGFTAGGLTVAQLLERGTFGLGTFENLDGEMIVLTEKVTEQEKVKVFQMKTDGSTDEVPRYSTLSLSFAQITNFNVGTPSKAENFKFANRKELSEKITTLVSENCSAAENCFAAVRVYGKFCAIEVRTVKGGQNEPLQEVLTRQKVEILPNREGTPVGTPVSTPVVGTLVGFRSPKYTNGISAEGDHFHFITDGNGGTRKGGHVLELRSHHGVHIEVKTISKFNLKLPKWIEDGVLSCSGRGYDPQEVWKSRANCTGCPP